MSRSAILGDLRLSRRGLSRDPPVARRSQGPRPRALARGIRRHAARRRLHLGPVLPEDRPSDRVGRAGRPGADREGRCTEDFPARSTISRASCPPTASCSARSASPTSPIASFFRNGAYAGFEVDPNAGRGPRRSSSATLAHPAFADAAAVRGRPAQRRDQGPAPGAARRRRAADRGDDGHARTAARNDAALGAASVLLAGNPMLEAGPQRRLGRDEPGSGTAAPPRARTGSDCRAFRPQGLAAAQQVLGHRQRAVDVLGGERLHQAAKREVGHREARRLAADEQARNIEVVSRTATEKPVVPWARWRSSRTRSGSCSSAAASALSHRRRSRRPGSGDCPRPDI